MFNKGRTTYFVYKCSKCGVEKVRHPSGTNLDIKCQCGGDLEIVKSIIAGKGIEK